MFIFIYFYIIFCLYFIMFIFNFNKMLNENIESVNQKIKEFENNNNQLKGPLNINENSNNVSIDKTDDNSEIKKSKENELIESNESNDNERQIKKIKTKTIVFHANSARESKHVFDCFLDYNNHSGLKQYLFNRDFYFRDEYNDFKFNIETTILYKAPNTHSFKEHHLSIQNEKLFIFSFKKNKYKQNLKLHNQDIFRYNSNTKLKNYNESHENLNNNQTKITNFSILNNSSNPNKSISDPKEIMKTSFNTKQEIIPYNELFDTYHPILVLNFDLMSASISLNIESSEIIIYILSLKNIKFILKLPIKDDNFLQKIFITIQNSIINSRGYYINLFGVSVNKNFYKNYYISYNEFESKSKTGDILLFRGLEFPAKLQRCYTKNEYDHVAILHKKNGFLYVYEATSKDGCKERNWREFIIYMWNLLYEKIVYRELIIEENDINKKRRIQIDLDEKIDIYMNQTQGKKYQMKLCPLICGSGKRSSQNENKWNEKEGFICSSLIMGAYLQMGICEYIKNINGIFPGDFSQNGFLPMKKPFKLGPEYIIDFSY